MEWPPSAFLLCHLLVSRDRWCTPWCKWGPTFHSTIKCQMSIVKINNRSLFLLTLANRPVNGQCAFSFHFPFSLLNRKYTQCKTSLHWRHLCQIMPVIMRWCLWCWSSVAECVSNAILGEDVLVYSMTKLHLKNMSFKTIFDIFQEQHYDCQVKIHLFMVIWTRLSDLFYREEVARVKGASYFIL